jgi:hypothetical protein
LEAGDVDLVLPFVPKDAEPEIRAMFDTVSPVRAVSQDAREVADRLFFETVVRTHRAGEGAPYTGLKPAGISEGPVIPLAEQAIATGTAQAVADFLTAVLHDELKRRLEQVNALAATKDRSVEDGRRYVEAMLGFEVYSHHLYQALQAPAHRDEGREPGTSQHHHG